MRGIVLVVLVSVGCGPVVEPEPIMEPPTSEITTCSAIIRAWCEHHIECGSVHDDLNECTGFMGYLYCGSDLQVPGEQYGAACYHDLTTAECDSWEMSWPGSCYAALDMEEGC